MTRTQIRNLAIALVAILLAVPAILIAVRELTPAGNPPVNDDVEKKLSDLKSTTDQTVAAAKDKAEKTVEKAKEQAKKAVKLPKDGLLVTYEGISQSRAQTHYAFYYPTEKVKLLDQHALFCDPLNEMCVALGAEQTGGIWVPLNAEGQIGRPTTHWMSVYNFDEAKSELKNVILQVRIQDGSAGVTMHADCEEEHLKAIEPALKKLAKAAGHPVAQNAEWRRETNKQWFLFSPPGEKIQN